MRGAGSEDQVPGPSLQFRSAAGGASVYAPEQVSDVYAHTFAARQDVYSRWTPNGWRPVREPLTSEVAYKALLGQAPAISGYMITPENESHVFAFDFDADEGYQQGVNTQRVMAELGIPSYIETSRRGAHLWTVIDRVVPARLIRGAMRTILGHANLPTNDPRIELRPGSDQIEKEGLGHAIRMPLMVHPKTGERSVIYDVSGKKYTKVHELLLEMDWASHAEIERLGRLWKPPVTHIPPSMRNPHKAYDDDGVTATQILQDKWGVVAKPGDKREVRCPLHGDKSASLYVMPDDRRVVCHSSVCILNNDGKGRGTWELRNLDRV